MKKTIIMLALALGAISTGSLANQMNNYSRTNEFKVYDHSPICKAIINGDVEAVKKFIEYGADVNQTSNGMTPLMVAARYNKVEIIKILLANGAEKEVKDENGYDAKKYAEMSKAFEALEVLKNYKN